MIEIKEEYLESTDSTNNEAKRRAEAGCKEGTVISAGMQSAGRGRRGRSWSFSSGESIATSMVLRPKLPTECLASLTLVAALAVRRAVAGLYGLETEIKWPNDIISNGRKICGILTELSATEGQANYVVVGIGVNVHNRDFPEEIKQIATSLDLEGATSTNCKELTVRIWQEFALLYEVFGMTGDLSVVSEEYNRYLVNRNREVCVLDPEGSWEGVARGIDATGALMVETKDDLRRVDAGEVSVRGIYGYV